MLFKEIIAVYLNNLTKNVNVQRGKNAALLIHKSSCTYWKLCFFRLKRGIVLGYISCKQD